MAMSADPIGQLLRREGHLPLTIEDRPRLDALLAAHPALLAGLRDALALAAQHFPVGSEARLRVRRYVDEPDEGDTLIAEIWTDLPPEDAMPRIRRMDTAWLLREAAPVDLPFVVTLRYR